MVIIIKRFKKIILITIISIIFTSAVTIGAFWAGSIKGPDPVDTQIVVEIGQAKEVDAEIDLEPILLADNVKLVPEYREDNAYKDDPGIENVSSYKFKIELDINISGNLTVKLSKVSFPEFGDYDFTQYLDIEVLQDLFIYKVYNKNDTEITQTIQIVEGKTFFVYDLGQITASTTEDNYFYIELIFKYEAPDPEYKEYITQKDPLNKLVVPVKLIID